MPAEFTAAEVFKNYIGDVGLDKYGRATKSPWQYDPVPKEIANAPVERRIFNVGPHKHVCYMGSLGNKHIPACPPDQPYILAQEIKKFTIDWSDQGDYKHKPLFIEAKELAQNMVSPTPGDESDLRRWGVFETENKVPSDDELKKAKASLFQTYDWLVKKADQLYRDGKMKEITPIYKVAAAQLRISDRPWAEVIGERQLCPACQQACDLGIAKHSCGAILDWKKALQYRLISKDDYAEAVEDGLVPGEKPKVATVAK
jgi:hypothetical protein